MNINKCPGCGCKVFMLVDINRTVRIRECPSCGRTYQTFHERLAPMPTVENLQAEIDRLHEIINATREGILDITRGI